MKIFLDTNVVIDVLSKRDGFEASLDVVRACESSLASGYVTTSSVTDIVYVLRNYLAHADAKRNTRDILEILGLSVIEESDILLSFNHEMSDFEDAVLAECAKRNKADYIVTRDTKDFARSPVPALSPTDFMALLRQRASNQF